MEPFESVRRLRHMFNLARTAGLLAALSVSLAGCTSSPAGLKADTPPSLQPTSDGGVRPGQKVETPPLKVAPPGATVKETFDYELVTHCGIRWAYFNGRRWITPRRDLPEGWGAASPQAGQMKVLSHDLAVFTSEGHELIFRPSKGPKPGCF